MSNKPVMKFRAGGMEIAIWEGRNGSHHASIRTQYRDKVTGEWKETKNWYINDMRNLLEQCKSAVDYLHEKEGNRQVGGRPIADDFAAPAPQKKKQQQEEPVQQEVTFDNDDIPF